MSEAVHPWVNEYRERLKSGKLPPHSSSHSIEFSTLYQLWHSQLCSRLLDLQSRLHN